MSDWGALIGIGVVGLAAVLVLWVIARRVE